MKTTNYFGQEIEMDEINQRILDESVSNLNKRSGPRVGDFVIIDGKYNRFSHDWGDSIQHSESGSFSLSKSGFISFSGGLNPSIDKSNLEETEELRDGSVWFFHHGFMRAHSSVNTYAKFRVYKLKRMG